MQVLNLLHARGWLKIQDAKNDKIAKKFAICAPSHNFIQLYLRNEGMCRQSEKKLVKQQYLLHMSAQYGERWPSGPLTAEIGSGVWGTP